MVRELVGVTVIKGLKLREGDKSCENNSSLSFTLNLNQISISTISTQETVMSDGRTLIAGWAQWWKKHREARDVGRGASLAMAMEAETHDVDAFHGVTNWWWKILPHVTSINDGKICHCGQCHNDDVDGLCRCRWLDGSEAASFHGKEDGRWQTE